MFVFVLNIVLCCVWALARRGGFIRAKYACESERHTAENIKKWTTEALIGIGLPPEELLQVEE